jgi:hypothetical protein
MGRRFHEVAPQGTRVQASSYFTLLLPVSKTAKMSNSDSYLHNGPPMAQPSTASSASLEDKTSPWLTSLWAVVSPETPTVDGGAPVPSFEVNPGDCRGCEASLEVG